MKKLLCVFLSLALLTGCAPAPAGTTAPETTGEAMSAEDFEAKWADPGRTLIQLNGTWIGEVSPDGTPEDAVYLQKDILYYEEGHDSTYGEGTEADAHSAAEAGEHVVVHITRPGTYVLTGKLPAGQIAVDLGEEAKDDPSAVVTLILDGVDISCSVAPAIIFYNVYECGDEDSPAAVVDTSAAGANVILAEGSKNYVNGSHVAKIYKPGTEDKLHKYDAAFYSKMSMNVGGEGSLNIEADNEGLDSELHLTINGGEISIQSGNDGINTNCDGVSVTTINGGTLRIEVTGTTGEGDGIDSNGWLVINGGTVESFACATSGDAGIDSDMGIHLLGGTVCATGNMLDRIEDGGQTHAVFQFAEPQSGGTYTLKAADGTTAAECAAPNGFSCLILSSPALTEGTYTLFSGDTQFEGVAGMGGHFGGGQIIERPDWPDRGDGDVEIPPQPTNPIVTHGEVRPPEGERPADMPVPPMTGEGAAMIVPPMPEDGENMPIPELPEGVTPPEEGFGMRQPGSLTLITGTLSTDFPLTAGANYFMDLRPVA